MAGIAGDSVDEYNGYRRNRDASPQGWKGNNELGEGPWLQKHLDPFKLAPAWALPKAANGWGHPPPFGGVYVKENCDNGLLILHQ